MGELKASQRKSRCSVNFADLGSNGPHHSREILETVFVLPATGFLQRYRRPRLKLKIARTATEAVFLHEARMTREAGSG